MATESVAIPQVSITTMPSDLPELIRAAEGSNVPFACIGRAQYARWIAAIADLLITADEVADTTPSDAAWLLYELTRVVQAFDARASAEREATA